MDGVDAGVLLNSLGAQKNPGNAAVPANVDAQIMQLLQQSAPTADAGTNEADQNAQIAASVTPKGSNRASTWLKNAPAAAGGEFYRMYKGITGQQMDPLARAVMTQAQQAAPGVATATDIAATAPAAMAVPGALGALGARGLLASAPAMGAVQGGVQGLLTADAGQHLQQGLMGAATGAALPLAGSALGKLGAGLTRSPEAQNLVSQGVQLPPGMLNPSGTGSKIEQALTHLPIIGSKIANARNAVPAQITERMFQDAAAPGTTLPKGLGINDAVTELKSGFDSAYSSALGGFNNIAPKIVRTTGPDIPLSDAFAQVASKPRLGLTQAEQGRLGTTLQDYLTSLGNGPLKATDLQALRSAIRDAGRDVSPIDNASRALRGFWDDAEGKVTQALTSQLPKGASDALAAADSQYGKFATVRNLAVSVKDRTPTMADWSTAIKNSTDPTVYAKGGGWNRDLIKSAASVVKPTVAHTGALGTGTIAPAVAAVEGAMHPAFIAAHPAAFGGAALGLGGLYGAYTGPGMRALAGQTAPQKAVMGLLNSVNPQARAAASLLLRGGLTQGLLQAPSQ